MAEHEEKEGPLLRLFAEYLMPPNYAEEEKEQLIEWLISKDAIAGTEFQTIFKNELEFILTVSLESKVDINDLDTADQTVILRGFITHYAKEMISCSKSQSSKDSQIVKILVKRGASIIDLDCDGNTPLDTAMLKGRIDLVRAMLEHSADLNTQNRLGKSILHIIIDNYAKCNDNWENYFAYIEIMRDLVGRGTNPNKTDERGMTAVHYAAKHCFTEVLQLFKELKADFGALTDDGEHLLMVACSELTKVKGTHHSSLKTIGLLLEQGLDVNLKNRYGFTCWHYAKRSHNFIVERRLERAGADTNAADDPTPLHSETVQNALDDGKLANPALALFDRDAKIVRLMARRGLDLNLFCENGLTPLHLAALSGNIKVVKELIESGADANCRDNLGRCYTPLHLASMRASELSDVRDYLDSVKSSGPFSLIRSCFELVEYQPKFSCEIIDALAKAGADVNAKDASARRTALHFATSQSHGDVVKALLKHGAFVDVQDDKGSMPLHNALTSDNLKGLRYLVEYGADINDIEAPWIATFKEIMSCKKPTTDRLLQYIVKLQAAGLPINDLYRNYLDDPKWQDYYAKCLDEIEKIRAAYLNVSDCFHDLVQENMKYSHNRTFPSADKLPSRTERQFSTYVTIIKGRHRAHRVIRESLLDSAKSALDQLTNVYWPDLCSEHIFSYLNNKHLRALVESTTVIELPMKFENHKQVELEINSAELSPRVLIKAETLTGPADEQSAS